MPWTFAHPAAVLPLRRLFPDPRLVVALVTGALVPDLAYYVGGLLCALPGGFGPLDAGRWGTWAHSPGGWLLLDAPLGALMAALLVAGRSWIAAPLPEPWRGSLQALPGLRTAGRRRVLMLLLPASAAGAATHLLWDGFTHAPGFFVQHLAWLRLELGLLDGRPWQLFNVLQHLSTGLGLAVLWRAQARWRRRRGPAWPEGAEPATERQRRAALVGLLAMAGVCGALLALPHGGWPGELHAWVVRSVIRATGLAAVGYGLLAVWWRAR